MISRPQYLKFMKSYLENGNLTQSAEHAGIDRKTARKYAKGSGAPPGGQGREVRRWKTHCDAFAAVWESDVAPSLRANPKLKARHLFRQLQRLHPGRFGEEMLRTFQRRVKAWRQEQQAAGASVRTLYFEQEREPGGELQLDWFEAGGLGVSIAGEAFGHKICHVVLPYSNWECASVCLSESFLSLRQGLQKGLRELGGAPRICQIDNSSTATHQLERGKRQRHFNKRFVELLEHYGMEPRTINIAAANENGDVESSHRHLREYLDAELTFRGHRDFATREAWQEFIDDAVARRNLSRGARFEQERACLRRLPPTALPEFDETLTRLNKYGLARVGKHGYSVPEVRPGELLRVRIYETQVEFYHDQRLLVAHPRLLGDSGVRIDWRHLLAELRRKPGAFTHYRHRAHFFPGEPWWQAYNTLRNTLSEKRLNVEYLNLLALALEHGRPRVEELLGRLMAEGRLNLDHARRELGATSANGDAAMAQSAVGEQNSAALHAQLRCYDGLITAALHQELHNHEQAPLAGPPSLSLPPHSEDMAKPAKEVA